MNVQAGDKVRIISREYVESLPEKGKELKYSFIGTMKEVLWENSHD